MLRRPGRICDVIVEVTNCEAVSTNLDMLSGQRRLVFLMMALLSIPFLALYCYTNRLEGTVVKLHLPYEVSQINCSSRLAASVSVSWIASFSLHC